MALRRRAPGARLRRARGDLGAQVQQGRRQRRAARGRQPQAEARVLRRGGQARGQHRERGQAAGRQVAVGQQRPAALARRRGFGLGGARASSATPRAASFQNTSVSSPQRTTNWSRPRRSAIQACRFSCAARPAPRRLSRAPALCTDARRSRGMRSAVAPAELRCAVARVRRTHTRACLPRRTPVPVEIRHAV